MTVRGFKIGCGTTRKKGNQMYSSNLGTIFNIVDLRIVHRCIFDDFNTCFIIVRVFSCFTRKYPDDKNSWVTRLNLHPQVIKDYEQRSGAYVHDWKFRCPKCDLPCASERGIHIHMSRSHKQEKSQKFQGRLVDKAVQVKKLEKQQEDRPKVSCEGQPLDNIFRFKYLGTIFAANASQHFDIDSRISMAMARCGRLRPIFDSEFITLSLKLRLYEAAVCSLLT